MLMLSKNLQKTALNIKVGDTSLLKITLHICITIEKNRFIVSPYYLLSF